MGGKKLADMTEAEKQIHYQKLEERRLKNNESANKYYHNKIANAENIEDEAEKQKYLEMKKKRAEYNRQYYKKMKESIKKFENTN